MLLLLNKLCLLIDLIEIDVRHHKTIMLMLSCFLMYSNLWMTFELLN